MRSSYVHLALKTGDQVYEDIVLCKQIIYFKTFAMHTETDKEVWWAFSYHLDNVLLHQMLFYFKKEIKNY
jgi:hypothetical protein